jgi:uncharacterized protein (TIRG00374 family)
MSTRHHVRWYALLGVASFAAVAAAVWYWRKEGFHWDVFAKSFQNLDLRWLAAACLLEMLAYLVRALRWRVFIRSQRPKSSLWGLFSSTAIGFSAIVLFGRPGELVRPYLIAKKENLPFSSQLAAWLLERIYDGLVALLLFGFALSYTDTSGVQVGESLRSFMSIAGQIVGFLALGCLILLLLLRKLSGVQTHRLLRLLDILPARFHKKIEDALAAFVDGIRSTQSNWAVAEITLYSLLEWILIVATYQCIFYAAELTRGMAAMDVLMFAGFVTFGSLVQLPGVGGGMQATAVVVLTQLFAMPLELAASMAVVIWAVMFLVITPVGLLLALYEGISLTGLKNVEAQALEMAESAKKRET